jgi:hypothetical protein
VEVGSARWLKGGSGLDAFGVKISLFEKKISPGNSISRGLFVYWRA